MLLDLRTFDGNARFVPSFRSKEANKRWRCSKPRVMLSNNDYAHEIGRPDSEPGGATMISMGVSRLHNAFLHGGAAEARGAGASLTFYILSCL